MPQLWNSDNLYESTLVYFLLFLILVFKKVMSAFDLGHFDLKKIELVLEGKTSKYESQLY